MSFMVKYSLQYGCHGDETRYHRRSDASPSIIDQYNQYNKLFSDESAIHVHPRRIDERMSQRKSIQGGDGKPVPASGAQKEQETSG